jgi:regulator of RNase E activity RraB
VSDAPASIFVDLGAIHTLPVTTHPVSASLRLFMRAAREDGFSSQEEYESLTAVEKALEAACERENILYLGRCTGSRCRDFYFYTPRGLDWEALAGRIMVAFPEYRFVTGTRDEPDWATYTDFLYPDGADRQRMESRRVCEALERHGDPLQSARDLDHLALFPTEESRKAFTDGAVALGFTVASMFVTLEDEEYAVELKREDVPSYDNIDAVVMPLYDLTKLHGGVYDGWGCSVEAPAADNA